ncbi:restriction endonuclease subunit S [Eubacterium pyruvativorans]|uniref:restriction endonuclease subunit S n=1 Tax=Eubacterium pyruvativorans TaxID=155865 RepID=UPI003F889F08
MIDTNALRQKIIDLAISGKLTEQFPEDGDAHELFNQIQEEKKKLVKEGKIKRQKKLPPVEEEEWPFKIPENWMWVHLGDLFDHNTGKALNSTNQEGNLYDYITTSNVYWDHFELKGLKQMRFTDNELDKCTVTKGDLLICEGGDIGRSAIWPYDFDMRIQNHLHRLRKLLPSLNTKFYYFIMWFYKQNNMISGRGIGLQGFSSRRVHSLVVPLPPLAEQKRIVEIIEQFEPLLNQIDDAQSRYSEDTEILKQKILDLAVRGKLVPQDPSDEPASVLLEKIVEEKKKLIKEGKIKKQKKLPPITEDEIPFEIPESWEWVHFSDLFSLSNGVASRGTVGGELHPVLRLADLTSGQINTESVRNIALSEKEFNTHTISEGDLVFIRVNGSREKVANAFLYTGEQDISYCDHLFCGHKVSSLFDSVYIMYIYHSNMVRVQVEPEIKTTAGQNTINQKSMGKIIIPLPPLAEQKRIVARLDELYGILQV